MYNKKNVKLLIVCCMIVANIFIANLSVYAESSLTESVNDNEETGQVIIQSNLIGDVNGDEDINSLDFAYMRKYLLDSKQSFPISNGLWAADTDGNGTFNSIDFAYMRQFLLGNITVFPAENCNKPNCFEYALFSGDTEKNMILYGHEIEIYGDIHSNSGIDAYIDRKAIIEGEIGAAKNVYMPDSVLNNYRIKTHEHILNMNDLSFMFIEESKLNQSYVSNNYNSLTGKKYYQDLIDDEGKFKEDIFTKNCRLNYFDEGFNPIWVLSGEELVLKKDRPIFFDGDVKLFVDKISGNGFIVATGNISIDNSIDTDFGLKYLDNGKVDVFNSSDIGLYSINGNIELQNHKKFQGLVYAPGIGGGGAIVLRDIEIYGSITARYIEIGGRNEIVYTKTSLHEMFLE